MTIPCFGDLVLRKKTMGLDVVELVLEAEDEFAVPIEGDIVPSRVGELYDAVIAALRKHQPERFQADPSYQDKVWEQFRAMIATQLGISPEKVVKTAHFVSDLGCN
jgi:acyl carrier protein